MAGFVLAGGSSSRMGRDKARLPLNSRLLVEDIAAKVRSVVNNVCLVGKAEQYGDLDIERIDDLQPGLGPIGGLETALQSGRGELNLITACDIPGLKTEWLVELVERARLGGHRCVVCRDSNGKTHPLCGIYRDTCLAGVQQAIARGRLRLLDLIVDLGAEVIQIPEPISNVNRPEDWDTWTRSQLLATPQQGCSPT